MLTHRPCGACSALVDLTTGCPHWKPYRKPGRVSEQTKALRQRQRVGRASTDPGTRLIPGSWRTNDGRKTTWEVLAEMSQQTGRPESAATEGAQRP